MVIFYAATTDQGMLAHAEIAMPSGINNFHNLDFLVISAVARTILMLVEPGF